MLWRKKEKPVSYDKTGKIPVLHVSICTGEKVAGFKDTASGRFEDRMLIKNEKDLQEFLRLYEVKEEELRKEW